MADEFRRRLFIFMRYQETACRIMAWMYMKHWFYTIILLCVYGKFDAYAHFHSSRSFGSLCAQCAKSIRTEVFSERPYIYLYSTRPYMSSSFLFFFCFIFLFSEERVKSLTEVESDWERWMWISPTTVLAVLCWVTFIWIRSVCLSGCLCWSISNIEGDIHRPEQHNEWEEEIIFFLKSEQNDKKRE